MVDHPLEADVDNCSESAFRKALKHLPALPNLDYKIRRANSLIDQVRGHPVNLDRIPAEDKSLPPILNKLTSAKRAFYDAHNQADKRRAKFDILDATADLGLLEFKRSKLEVKDALLPDENSVAKLRELDGAITELLTLQSQIRAARKKSAGQQDEELERLEEKFDDPDRPTFVWRLDFAEVFHRKGATGFDLVLGNPPYVVITDEKFTAKDIGHLSTRYEVAQYKVDLYHLFMEQGVRVARVGGVLAFVVPNQWFTQKFTEKLRRFCLRESQIIELVVLEGLVFQEADVHNALVFLRHSSPSKKHVVRIKKPESPESVSTALVSTAVQAEWASSDDGCFETRLSGKTGDLVSRLRKTMPMLGECVRISLGCQAYNSSKHTKQQIENRVFHADRKLGAEYMEELAGKDVGRYSLERKKGQWIRYGSWLHDYRERDWLEGPRILVREIPNRPPYQIPACYVEKSYCNYKTILNVNPAQQTVFSMKFLTGVLNSRMVSFLYPYIANKLVADSFPRISVADLRRMPCCPYSPTDSVQAVLHDQIVILVDKILTAKRKNPQADTGDLESEIDERVYRLYGLTKDEIKLVEASLQK